VCHHKRRCLRGAPCINEIGVGEVTDAALRRLTRLRQGFGEAGA
jgi:hypothetical protein